MLKLCVTLNDYSYSYKLGQLKATYYPMEIDTSRTEAEKYPLMVEWLVTDGEYRNLWGGGRGYLS